jgi:metal-responsive CopG/Arc/MetJ family transcriptional regulator
MPRVIQVPMNDDLLRSLDELSAEKGRPRASIIREACERYLADERERSLDDAYEEGYRRVPESSAMGEAQAALAGQVLEAESW